MIGIVLCNDLNMCPYIDKYISACEKLDIKYEIIIWDRTGEDRTFPDNYRVYREKSEIHKSKWKKIGAFWRFKNFLETIIKENKYDKLIMLTTLPAVLCYSVLVRNYKGRYIFDFRDLSFEKFVPYRKTVSNICDYSYFTCISSPGFAEILGNKDFVIANNFRYKDLEKAVNYVTNVKECVNLLHIGITRGEEYNRKLADVFGDDSRFQVYIVGSGNDTETFVEYVKKFANIHVIGTYNNQNKKKYTARSNMLLYYYPCDFNCNRALANKYYDGLIYKKPLIGNINTYSGKRLMEKHIGISLDISDVEFADKVYEYITNLNYDEYKKFANDELNEILTEDKKYLSRIEDFLRKNN